MEKTQLRMLYLKGVWVGQSVKHRTLDVGSDHDPTVREIKPPLLVRSLLGIPSLPLTLSPFSLSFSLKINKHLKIDIKMFFLNLLLVFLNEIWVAPVIFLSMFTK